METKDETTATPKKRGFAGMDPDRHREIASAGGKASHASGRAHEFAPGKEAQEAGRLGGLKVSSDRKHMAEIGVLGGNALARNNPRAGRGQS